LHKISHGKIPEVIYRSLGTIFHNYRIDRTSIQRELHEFRIRYPFWRGKIKEMPLAVIRPASTGGLRDLVSKAREKHVCLLAYGSGPGIYRKLPIRKSIIIDIRRLVKLIPLDKHAFVAPAGATLYNIRREIEVDNHNPEESKFLEVTVGDHAIDAIFDRHTHRSFNSEFRISDIIVVGPDGEESVFKPEDLKAPLLKGEGIGIITDIVLVKITRHFL